VGRGGIVRAAAIHQRAFENVRAAARSLGLTEIEVAPSRLIGAEGNREFFLRARLLPKPNSGPPPLPLG
jgi:23S rRNA (cytidine1920-2'-O)/16S rRNA (cytidine1409-2'-O)-methyltransferase